MTAALQHIVDLVQEIGLLVTRSEEQGSQKHPSYEVTVNSILRNEDADAVTQFLQEHLGSSEVVAFFAVSGLYTRITVTNVPTHPFDPFNL